MKRLQMFLAVLMAVFMIVGCTAINSILSNPKVIIALATDLGSLISTIFPSVATQILTKASAAESAANIAVVDVTTLDAGLSTLLTAVTEANSANPNSDFNTIVNNINTILNDTSLSAADSVAVLNGFISGLQKGASANKTSAKLKAVAKLKISPASVITALQSLK